MHWFPRKSTKFYHSKGICERVILFSIFFRMDSRPAGDLLVMKNQAKKQQKLMFFPNSFKKRVSSMFFAALRRQNPIFFSSNFSLECFKNSVSSQNNPLFSFLFFMINCLIFRENLTKFYHSKGICERVILFSIFFHMDFRRRVIS